MTAQHESNPEQLPLSADLSAATEPPAPQDPTGGTEPCWVVDARQPKFCAALANGHKRCKEGTCHATGLGFERLT